MTLPHDFPNVAPRQSPLVELMRDWHPRSELGVFTVARVLPHLPDDLAAELVDRMRSIVVMESALRVRVHRRAESRFGRGHDEIEDWGLVSRKVVTNAGVNAIVDAFQNTVEVELFNFHGIGTGTNAEAVGDTALQTELTTEYNPNSTRDTGTQGENGANVYQTVGVNTLDSGTPAITEHGVLTQAATGGGTLLDRSVFSAINLDGTAGDGLQSTYELTVTAGS